MATILCEALYDGDRHIFLDDGHVYAFATTKELHDKPSFLENVEIYNGIAVDKWLRIYARGYAS